VVCGIIIAVKLRASFIFLAMMSAYVMLGLAEEVIFYRKRRAEELAAKAAGAVVAVAAAAPPVVDAAGAAREAHDEAAQDEEVLRELGAFDEDEDHAAGEDGPKPPSAGD